MKLTIQPLKKALNKAYLKEKVGRSEIEQFKRSFLFMLSRINENESEEHGKNIVSDFLKEVWYRGQYEINTKDRKDLVIHAGKTAKEPVGVILEAKKLGNKSEMISAEKPNAKAMQEMLLYYLRERIDCANKFIRHLIITNIYEWYIIDERFAEQYFFGNAQLRKDYEQYKLSRKPTAFFYEQIAKPFLDELNTDIPSTYFDIRDYEKIVRNTDNADDNKLIALYKILSPVHLLKGKFANDSNTLDKGFYEELLHIIGLEEIKEGSKKLIQRKKKRDEASLLENTIAKIEERDSIYKLPNPSAYGVNKEEQIRNVALELCITWVNRILFMKLLEAQLVKYHKGNRDFLFLNSKKVHDYDELSNLFFGVLAERPAARKERLREKFGTVPYLNSSLFERTELEWEALEIVALDNGLLLPLASHTVLKDDKGKSLSGSLPTLDYLFRFLDAYDFSSEGAEEIQEENKNLINASVLGLIFEKINGYKDGSFFTPGFVTMYMCRETLRRAVVQAFNQHMRTAGEDVANAPDRYKTLDDVYNAIRRDVDEQTANDIINALTICDPAVGSGHFLVSALNELIAIKSELGILRDAEGRRLRDVEVVVENDELIVTEEGRLFQYNPQVRESRRIQETLFREKQTIIEHCLFGVDINPNSVKICRLRLWIELLKNAYYTAESGYTELETLPNIDINIKTGNSLVSRFALDADLGPALRSLKWDINAYRGFVQDYKEAKGKEEKRALERLIDEIKKDFRTEIGKNDPKLKRLNKLNGEYELLMSQQQIFELTKAQTKARKAQLDKLEKEIAKLADEVEEIKSNKLYENAFEWRFEFPEVLDSDARFVGFDVVIGNPPYVQIQKLGDADKVALESQHYETYTRTGDLYQLFYERGFQLLKDEALLCYITSNKWMRTDYGRGTRNFFATKTRTEFLVDFGMAQMFDAATTYTNIILLHKSAPSDQIRMCRIKNDYDTTVRLDDYVDFASIGITQPGENSWIAYDKKEYGLIKKIEAAGTPLKDWDIQINYGLKTGFNEAFIIDTATRDRLVAEDLRSAEIIKPILRGEDIKAYVPEWAGKWLIFIPWHFPLHLDSSITGASTEAEKLFAEGYPAVYAHLSFYKKQLAARNKAETGIRYEWYALQRWGANYYEDFNKPKIIYPNMTKYLPFVYDEGSFVTNQKCFIITGKSLGYLTAFLNSKIFRFAFKEYFPELLGDTRELSKVFFENVTVKPVDAATEKWFKKLVDEVVWLKNNHKSIEGAEQQIFQRLVEIYELSKSEVATILGSETIGSPNIKALSGAVSE